MIFWYTDNEISRTVGGAFREIGIECKHINEFTPQPSIFYGIHRGCGNAMHVCKHTGNDFWYLDNGYFDAEYVDRSMLKHLDGTYRLVKNGMHERYTQPGLPLMPSTIVESVLLIPPSPYSAYFHNTTMEDWCPMIGAMYPQLNFTVRDKSADIDIEGDIHRHHCVMAFNSMAVIKAIEMGKPVMDTHGVLQTSKLYRYRYEDMKEFYGGKQFTLNEISKGAANEMLHRA